MREFEAKRGENSARTVLTGVTQQRRQNTALKGARRRVASECKNHN